MSWKKKPQACLFLFTFSIPFLPLLFFLYFLIFYCTYFLFTCRFVQTITIFCCLLQQTQPCLRSLKKQRALHICTTQNRVILWMFCWLLSWYFTVDFCVCWHHTKFFIFSVLKLQGPFGRAIPYTDVVVEVVLLFCFSSFHFSSHNLFSFFSSFCNAKGQIFINSISHDSCQGKIRFPADLKVKQKFSLKEVQWDLNYFFKLIFISIIIIQI